MNQVKTKLSYARVCQHWCRTEMPLQVWGERGEERKDHEPKHRIHIKGRMGEQIRE